MLVRKHQHHQARKYTSREDRRSGRPGKELGGNDGFEESGFEETGTWKVITKSLGDLNIDFVSETITTFPKTNQR